ncbi:MAG TPA: TerC family protein [Bryobacteraceae bacterium]|nr:TerC family protein [Bryobacteraceae bacterium]
MPSSVPRLLSDCLSLILIDLLLAGDNALVIAMAVRSLPAHHRRIGIAFGAAAAVVLRIALTIVAAQLLNIELIKLLGGAFVLWIALQVMSDANSPPAAVKSPRRLLQAIWFIIFADITMSTDNILAIAGASRGSIPLIVFGLCVSIPFVVFASNLLAMLMDRYPAVVYVGTAILAKVGAEMMLTDPFVERKFHPSKTLLYLGEAVAVVAVLLAGRSLSHAKRNANSRF